RKDASLWPAARGTKWWRRRDSRSISFETGWTMPSSGHGAGAGRVIRIIDPDPSAGSPRSAVSLSMSLYRAKEVGPPAPLGVATSLVVERHRVHRLSPVFTLPLRAKATIALIEPASASPLPSALHA